MNIRLEPKEITDAYSTPIVQQTSFWSKVKEQLGMSSCAFDYSVRNSELIPTWEVIRTLKPIS